jgi:SRSO17 transposase
VHGYWKHLAWRVGSKQKLCPCFAARRICVVHRDYWRSELRAEEWLLIERPTHGSEPTKYWLATLSAGAKLAALAKLAKHRWIIGRDYEERKQEQGFGHYESRAWRGFHHPDTLCIAARSAGSGEKPFFSV